MRRSTPPTLILHGGAGTIASDNHGAVREGLAAALAAGQRLLAAGASAVEVAVAAIRHLEDNPAFNAGRGACLNAAGRVEVDAGIMRSRDRRSGAVAGLAECRDPIVIARQILMESPHALLVGDGAAAFARARGLGSFGAAEVETPRARERWRRALAGEEPRDNRADTVGAVVLDAAGELCAAGSTGGVLLKAPGRAGDTPLIGAGFYADPLLGACCCTGVGEAIMTHVLAYAALRAAAKAPQDPAPESPEAPPEGPPKRIPGSAQAIASDLCAEIAAAHGGAAVGLILLRPDGTAAIAHRSDHMSWGIARPGEPPRLGLAIPGALTDAGTP